VLLVGTRRTWLKTKTLYIRRYCIQMEMKSINEIQNTVDAVARNTYSDDDSLYAVVEGDDIGLYFGLIRRTDLEPVASRRTGDTLVARFEGERESEDEEEGLGELFG